MPPINSFFFKFEEKAQAIYKLVMTRHFATEFRQTGGVTNGFELFRKLTQKLDP